VRWDVDFTARTVAYYGCNGEVYVEAYPACFTILFCGRGSDGEFAGLKDILNREPCGLLFHIGSMPLKDPPSW
jgi:hypothetical protein